MTPIAVVMNLFYTGLGVARSLGEKGVRVIGLTAHRRITAISRVTPKPFPARIRAASRKNSWSSC